MKRILALVAFAVLALAASAAEWTVCQPWEITVVDPAGKPVAGCAVMQLWGGNFREEFVGKKANAVTDASGRVSFPARSIEPPATPGWKKALRKLDGKGGPEATASVFVSQSGFRSVWVQSRRDPLVTATRDGLRSRVVLEREKP